MHFHVKRRSLVAGSWRRRLLWAMCCSSICVILQADTVVFDDELSPGQLRNLEKAFMGGQGGKPVSAGLCAGYKM